MSVQAVYKSSIPAKINLSLAITGRAENLHTLKMLVCPYPKFVDTVEFLMGEGTEISDISVTAEFDGFDRERFIDFFLPKAQRIADKFGVGGRFVINKGVPLGAGLGGSSASIAATLVAIKSCAEELGKDTALDDRFLLGLGSDVPCMLFSKPCIVQGVGEIIKPVDIPVDIISDIGIEIASGGSDTVACYALYDQLRAKDAGVDTSQCYGDEADIANNTVCLDINSESIEIFKNDLTMSATMLNANIANLISKLKKDYKFVSLCGSGSSVLFKNRKL